MPTIGSTSFGSTPTASNALPKSIAITAAAKAGPCVRSAFVPPALPLPSVRMSTPRTRPTSRLPINAPSR
jgi:hypothetical protein